MSLFEDIDPIPEISLSALDGYPQSVIDLAQPRVLRGFVKHWPAVQHALKSDKAISDYVLSHYNGKPVHLMQAEAEHKRRLFYNQDLTGFNFTRSQLSLHQVFQDIERDKRLTAPPTRYVGSTRIDSVFPSFRQQNDLPAFPHGALASIWMGNQSRVAAHYDAPDNIACNVAGKRRFTLFPPQQIDNLYVGPIDFTPAGQPASLVDFHQPDFVRYPKFKQALKHAQCAVLDAGDAIYIPATWWHHVEALADFNVLVNYWWRQVEDHIGIPNDAMIHAMLAIKALPQAQRKAWQQLFDHYVFNPQTNAHIPDNMLGMLDEVSPTVARQMRALLVNKLNR
jgi:hypothetical protein